MQEQIIITHIFAFQWIHHSLVSILFWAYISWYIYSSINCLTFKNNVQCICKVTHTCTCYHRKLEVLQVVSMVPVFICWEDMFLQNKTLAYRLFSLSWFYSKIIRFVIGVISLTLAKMVYLHSRKSNRKNKEYEYNFLLIFRYLNFVKEQDNFIADRKFTNTG